MLCKIEQLTGLCATIMIGGPVLEANGAILTTRYNILTCRHWHILTCRCWLILTPFAAHMSERTVWATPLAWLFRTTRTLSCTHSSNLYAEYTVSIYMSYISDDRLIYYMQALKLESLVLLTHLLVSPMCLQ
jgi:hypothetical protein